MASHYYFDGLRTFNDTTVSPPPGVLDIRRFGAKPDGSGDAGPAISAAIAAAGPGGTVWVPTGTFRVETPIQTLYDDLAICGDGRKSTIYWPGWAVQNPSYIHILQLLHSKIEVFGLRFKGDNGDVNGAGFQWATGDQRNFLSSAIGIGGGTYGAPNTDIRVHDCWFENLFGFPIQNGNAGIFGHTNFFAAVNNHCRWCAQGLNVNARVSLYDGNILYNAEGIECGLDGAGVAYPEGMTTIVVNNKIRGGFTLGIAVYSDNIICSHNVIDMSEVTSTSSGQTSGVTALNLQGVRACSCIGNTIRDPGVHGILIQADSVPGSGRTPLDVTVAGNSILSTRLADASNGQACALILANGAQRLIINGNTLYGVVNGLGNYNTFYGILLESCSHVAVTGNDISSVYSQHLTAIGGDRITIGNNVFDHLGQYGVILTGNVDRVTMIGNQIDGASIDDIRVDAGVTRARLIGNVATTVSLDAAAVKYKAGNSWDDP